MIGFNYNLDNYNIDYQKVKDPEIEKDIYINHKYYRKCGHLDEYILELKGEEVNEKLYRMEEEF